MPELHESLDTADFAFIEAEPANVPRPMIGRNVGKNAKDNARRDI